MIFYLYSAISGKKIDNNLVTDVKEIVGMGVIANVDKKQVIVGNDKIMNKYLKEAAEEMLSKSSNPNRPLFSEETTKKILNHITEEKILNQEN